MKKITMWYMAAALAGIATANVAFAQTAAKTISPAKMVCADFETLDDAYKPAVIYWATGVDKLGVRETDQITIDTAHPVAEQVTEECKATPKVNIVDKIRMMAKAGKLSIYKRN
ncbi:HdeA family protein [Burkholderia glumae]|uniref:HdeA family protein n=1 Tax=Burkholderia glumae TaxID=337 RepID=UPI00054AEE85|nr:HdeA family protein [Burkholderia glumae]KHJ64150.1 HdeA [Burkholderia glumae]